MKDKKLNFRSKKTFKLYDQHILKFSYFHFTLSNYVYSKY